MEFPMLRLAHMTGKESSNILGSSRIAKEIQRFITNPTPGIAATPQEDSLQCFNAMVDGPEGSPFQHGRFRLEIFVPKEYPLRPPQVKFLTKIYHPNIDNLGHVSLFDDRQWSPVLLIETMLLSLQGLLSAPDLDNPFAIEAAKHYRENRMDAERVSRQWTEMYAARLNTRSRFP